MGLLTPVPEKYGQRAGEREEIKPPQDPSHPWVPLSANFRIAGQIWDSTRSSALWQDVYFGARRLTRVQTSLQISLSALTSG